MLRKHEKINKLSKNFHEEEKELISAGITTWERLKSLTNKQISLLTRQGRSSTMNLNRLRGIAKLVCELNIPQEEAAILIHSGITSAESLAKYSPQDLVIITGRLERKISYALEQRYDLTKASLLIKKAKEQSNRQIIN